jgi:ATP-dependent 26S proteasome regulatory subunit
MYISGSSQHDDTSLETLHQVTEELNDLQLSQDGGCVDEVNLFYRIVEGTKWNVELIGSLDKKESSKNESACSLSSIGGLQNVIEEIHEIIQLALKNTSLIQGVYCFGTETFTLQSLKV